MTLSYANYVFSGHKETKNTLKFAKQLIFRNRWRHIHMHQIFFFKHHWRKVADIIEVDSIFVIYWVVFRYRCLFSDARSVARFRLHCGKIILEYAILDKYLRFPPDCSLFKYTGHLFISFFVCKQFRLFTSRWFPLCGPAFCR